ncbi:MAG: hypothetical protein QNJ81_08300, partial [Acidimicrobiia bacterium]|nr:hypothetical protein [Acidimicrobiia bacterium]
MLLELVVTASQSSLVDTLDKAVVPLIAAAATLVGAWFANNYRRQMKLRLADQRREAYARLWEITGVGAPTRLDGWGTRGRLKPPERQQLYEALTDWYYAEGNGMLLTRTTRTVYLNTKHNLVCKTGQLRPPGLESQLPDKIEDHQLRGILSIKQLSLLRTQLKSDLAIYGQPYVGKLEPHESYFLLGSGVDLGSKAWAQASGRKNRL